MRAAQIPNARTPMRAHGRRSAIKDSNKPLALGISRIAPTVYSVPGRGARRRSDSFSGVIDIATLRFLYQFQIPETRIERRGLPKDCPLGVACSALCSISEDSYLRMCPGGASRKSYRNSPQRVSILRGGLLFSGGRLWRNLSNGQSDVGP